ncbi:MAG TPA: tRNA (adenosine(37)-N6)-threonylcarbamoyltransferase complex dimerization subunit type 1 TsaB [Gemmatimonadaceae bacterium]|nr:tRNA (adenosine(37)-N6)-threonylcarbamoyltransferase complex dimerization subunit type 1 TsaB [Gemmatimonadaceae bacterium]
MRVLVIDASTYRGSAAVIDGNMVIAAAAIAMRGAHEERLMPAVARVLDAAGVDVEGLDAVACGSGPGSFTSLRIAASIAKGIAFAAQRPLYAIPTLLLVAATCAPSAGRVLPWLDALRGEVYAACYETGAHGEWMEFQPVMVVPRESLPKLASTWGASLVSLDGNASRADESGTRRSAVMIDGVAPRAAIASSNDDDGTVPMAAAAARLTRWLERARPVSLSSWEPAYGRPAEAQARWEAAHGRALPVS